MSQSKPQAFNPPNVQEPPPTYKQVCITPILPTSKLVTLAGQTGKANHGFLDQVKGAYDNVLKCLEAAHATPRDIIHVRHYIVNETGDEELNAKDVVERGWGDLWIQFMDEKADGHRPPDTVLGVASLAIKGLMYEVEVWALVSQ
jgi:enamine deaminase RidA (YjgF/YER057c/UK114 family)